MLNQDFDNEDILTLPNNQSFPLSFPGGSLSNIPNNIFFKKRMDEIILNFYDKFVLNNNRQSGVIVVGAPGIGKV